MYSKCYLVCLRAVLMEGSYVHHYTDNAHRAVLMDESIRWWRSVFVLLF